MISSGRTIARGLLGLGVHCLSLAITIGGFLLLSPRLVGDEGEPSTLEARAVVEQLRTEVTRQLGAGSRFLPDELRRLIRLAGELRIVDSVPELVFLLDNCPELAAPELIPALGKIGDERAVVTLVGQFRWQSGSGQVLEAIDALAELNRPVARTLIRALASKDDLTRRRASYDIALLGRSEIQGRIQDRVSPARRQLFELPSDVKNHLRPLLKDPVVAVRYEALSAYLSVAGDGQDESLDFVAKDPDLSVQQLLISAHARRIPWDEGAWLSIRSLGLDGPSTHTYRAISEWVPWKNGLSLRIALSNRELSLSEPIYLLNRPIWMRIELRNDGSSVAEVPTAQGVPLMRIGVRDEFGTTEPCGPHPQESHFTVKPTALAPGESLTWEFLFLRECWIRANGAFTLHGDTEGKGPVLLTLSVRDIPKPPWRSDWYPHLGMSPTTVAYPRKELPGLPKDPPSPKSPESPAPKRAVDARETLTRFVERQDPDELLMLTHRLSIEEITEQLKTLKVPVPYVDGRKEVTFAQAPGGTSLFFSPGPLLLDRAGVVHVVYSKSHIVREPDYLGNRERWLTETYYTHGDSGDWSTPVQVSSGDLELGKVQLLLDADGALLLVATVGNERTTPTSRGLEPGHGDVILRRREPGGEWGAIQSCLTVRPKLLQDFDAAIDDDGRLHLVWAPWFGNDHLQLIHHRVATRDGWQPEEVLPVGDRNLSHPKLRFIDGQPVLITIGQTPDNRTIGLYWSRLTDDGWSRPVLIEDGLDSHVMPMSRAPHPFVLGALEPKEPGTMSVFRMARAGMEKVLSSFGFPDGDYFSDLVSIAADASGRAYGLVNWHGVIVLFRTADSGSTEAIIVWEPSRADFDSKTGPPFANGRPDLLIHGNDWHALWATQGGTTTTVQYRHGSISNEGWMDARRLSFLLRPTVGFVSHDLGVVQAGVFSEARTHEEQGRMHDAIERYVYLILNSTAFSKGGYGAKGGEILLALERLKTLYESGDKEARAYLWGMVRSEPEALYRSESLWRLLNAETEPRVRTESAPDEHEHRYRLHSVSRTGEDSRGLWGTPGDSTGQRIRRRIEP